MCRLASLIKEMCRKVSEVGMTKCTECVYLYREKNASGELAIGISSYRCKAYPLDSRVCPVTDRLQYGKNGVYYDSVKWDCCREHNNGDCRKFSKRRLDEIHS